MAEAHHWPDVRIIPGLARLAARAPVIVFLIGTFGWAWLFWAYWIPAMPSGGLAFSPAFLLTAILGGMAPSLAAIATSWLIGGGHAVRQLLEPLGRIRAPLGWYALALLLVPAITAVSAIVQALLLGPLQAPDLAVMLPLALVWPLLAALGEEIGWRGFMLPRLQPSLGVLGTALTIGVVWGLWHLPADWIGLKHYGDWFLAAFLVNGPLLLTGHAVIMSWLWNRTHGSLAIIVLYHLSITASAMLAPESASSGGTGVLASAIGAGLVWAAAIVLLLLRPRDFDL